MPKLTKTKQQKIEEFERVFENRNIPVAEKKKAARSIYRFNLAGLNGRQRFYTNMAKRLQAGVQTQYVNLYLSI